MKNQLVNLRLEADLIEILDHMAGRALNRQAVARMFLIAALEAAQAHGVQISLPPKLVVAEDETKFYQLNPNGNLRSLAKKKPPTMNLAGK